MTFLALDGLTVRCAANQVSQKYEEHRLDRERMFDGTLRMTRGAVFRNWQIQGALLTEANANTLLAKVLLGQIVTASGDLVGDDTPVMLIPGSDDPVITASGYMRRVSFEMKETGGPLPPDRTALPFLFWQRGVGYWQDRDNSKATPALDGDLVYTWEDQSGNGRDGQAYSVDFEADDLRPVRDGDELRFGVGAFSDPGAGSGRTLIRSDAITGINELHFMCGIRAALDPPATTGRSVPFTFRSNSATDDTHYPDTDGHVKINFGFTSSFDVGDPVADLTSLHILSISASNVTKQIIAKLDNIQILSYDLVGAEAVTWAPSSGFSGSLQAIGLGALSGNHGWEGWFRDVLMVDAIMTTAQERSWFDYMRGATTEPPLPI